LAGQSATPLACFRKAPAPGRHGPPPLAKVRAAAREAWAARRRPPADRV